jgi:diguanylate cyclase (GGDEF)-like protein/PAS domain S-box-containing protein
MPASALVTTLAVAWAGSQLIAPWGSSLVGWALTAVAFGLVSFACRRTALAAPDPVNRRFWLRLAGATGMIDAGLISAGAAVAGVPYAKAVAVLCIAASLVALGAALVGLPAAARSRREWLTFLLDGGTILVAGGLFAWHAVLTLGILDSASFNPYLLVGLAIFAAVGLFAVIRVSLAWSGPVDHAALGLIGFAVLIGVGMTSLHGVLIDHPVFERGHVGVPLSATLWVVATNRQRRAYGRTHRPRRHAARRPFSLLPYVAAAAVGALLLVAGPTDPRERVLVHGGILFVGIVLVRHVIASYDNARLLRRVDAGMLELRHHERRFRSMVQQAADIIVITTPDGSISYASPALRQLVGMADEGERFIRPYIHPEDWAVVAHHADQVAAEPAGVVTFRARLSDGHGGWRWLEIISTNLLADPSVRGVVSNARDITDMLHYQEQLAHQALHDELTGLANRTLLLERAEAQLAAGPPSGASIALIDLDDFKEINDRLGHDVGDALLTRVGSLLADCVPPESTIARLGGDEFAILLVDVPADDATNVLDRLMSAFEAPITAAGYELLVQASIGLAGGDSVEDPSELLRRADVALYAAKELGKGRHATYHPTLDQRSAQHAQIGAELRQALDAGDQLHLLYQPIVALPGGELRSVEALVRWQHPERGMVSPADFIPIAERTGVIVPLGRWILREACARAAAWSARPGVADLTISVNVSARQLREPGFPNDVAAILAETGLEPTRLTIEVTETAVFDSDASLEALRAIHSLGVRVALDDFGTGHSSLGLLRSCPVDILKVDKSFVDGVTGTAEQAAIAISLVQITSTMRLLAVAEGVETDEQARTLHRLGYRLAQGFYFARPLPADDITALLTAPPALPLAA